MIIGLNMRICVLVVWLIVNVTMPHYFTHKTATVVAKISKPAFLDRYKLGFGRLWKNQTFNINENVNKGQLRMYICIWTTWPR